MKRSVYFFILILLTLVSTHSFSQGTAEDPVALEEKFEQIRIERLKRIRKELVQLQSNIYLAKKKIDSEPDLVTKLKLESELEKLQKELEAKKYLFIETATNVNLLKREVEKKATDFTQDLKEIMDPLLDGIKQISERPRAIEDLRDKIEALGERLAAAKEAKKKLTHFAKENTEKGLDKTVQRSLKTIEKVQRSLEIELEDSQFKLLKLEKSEGGVFSNFSFAIFDFFKTKGKNLLLALAVFLAIYWVLGIGKNRFISLFMGRIGKTVEEPGHVNWMKRPLKVFYTLFTFVCALFMAVLTLYFLNDWVLVTFIIFLLVGLVWSSRNYVPEYFEMFKTILNFGPIREGERLVFEGLPWRVKSLGYYCRLENPALAGGTMRISTKALMNSYSRPVGDTEPWFPTGKDDWVELNDGTFGKVISQTPEFVTIKLIGEQLKYIHATEFLGMSPVNLSGGYGIVVTFGVDYAHQPFIITEVLENLKNFVFKRLVEDFPADKDDFYSLSVELKEAGASSLDFFVLLKCDGRLASRKPFFERKLTAYLVEACNKYGYVIPFQQITIHQAESSN